MQEPPDGAPPPRIAPPRPDALPAPVLPPGTFRANLYLYLPDGRIEWYALLPGQLGDGRGVFIGRSERCHVRIDDDAVSSRHARILADEGGLRVEDLGSTNGTTLDGEPVDSAPLPDGALLGLGNVDARFIYSFRQPVVRLSLSFVEGPDAGRVETLSGASTTLGRLNCALMLKGPGVAAQHVRIDAYGHDLIYVVALSQEAELQLGDAVVHGVVHARPGDVLTVGPHRIVIQTVDAVAAPGDTDPMSAPPPPVSDGPLPLDAAMLEAELQGHNPAAYDDHTIMDLSPLGAMVAKVLAGEAPAPGSAVRPPAEPPEPSPHSTLSLRPIPRAAPPPRRRSPGLWIALAALAALVLVGALMRMPRAVEIESTLAGGATATVSATVYGRLLPLPTPAGGLVAAGAEVAQLIDLNIQAELDRLSTQIGALQALSDEQAPSAAALAAALESAQSARTDATKALAAAEADVFAGRASWTRLPEARAKLKEAEGRLDGLSKRQPAAKAPGRAERRAAQAARDAAVAELTRLLAERKAMTDRLRVALRAPGSGRLSAADGVTPGTVVPAGRTLLRIAADDPLRAVFPLSEAPTVDKIVLRIEGIDTPVEVPIVVEADAVRVELPNPAGALHAGARVRAAIPLPSTNLFLWLLEASR